MVSDNGTTFVGAANQLKSEAVNNELTNRGTEWRFIPKRAPWYGGWWERLIGMTKSALKKILGRAYISYEELQTVLTEIEATLNDRPLTYVSTDCQDPEPLTPSHLLYGRRVTSLGYNDDPIVNTESNLSSITRRANHQKTLISRFRERWKHEYLTALREHHRTTGNNQQKIAHGDVVQIHDDVPRVRWRLGVVEELNRGKDGHVRSVTLRTNNGVTNRPITKLYPLEVTGAE